MKKDGYEPRTFVLQSKFNAVSVLNLFRLLGWGIAATGALMKYDRKAYNIELEPKNSK